MLTWTKENLLLPAVRWFDNGSREEQEKRAAKGVDWARVGSFVLLHVMCLGVFWVGWSWFAVLFAVGFYMLRAFFITGFYHRYFSHRTYKTSRPFQFVLAVLGNTAVQRGALWWAAHHRQHHAKSDQDGDPHSPIEHSLYWAHMGWITAAQNFPTRYKLIPDFTKFKELRFLDRFDTIVPFMLAGGMFAFGSLLERFAPSLGVTGPMMLIWGFFISTTILFHVTCLVNSAAHLTGRRRYKTTDSSRNSLWIALLTMGEGWHNNHHHYPGSTRQGFYWWEIDVTYYTLKMMSWVGLIWDLKPVPEHALESGRVGELATE